MRNLKKMQMRTLSLLRLKKRYYLWDCLIVVDGGYGIIDTRTLCEFMLSSMTLYDWRLL